MKDIVEEALQELFIAITARWQREDGTLGIGVSRSQLTTAGEISSDVLDNLLDTLRKKLAELGVELLEYMYDGDIWYAVRSSYVCPSELRSEEEAMLALFISELESSSKAPSEILVKNCKQKLIGGKYFSEHQFDKIVRNLETLGYIKRKRSSILYGPRTLLEFSEESRKHIAEESHRLVF